MDNRITSFSSARILPKSILTDNRSPFKTLNKPTATKSKQLFLLPTATKKIQSKSLNNLFISPKKMSLIQPIAIADKKGLSLYQQIERNGLFSNGVELTNRFNFKV